MKIKNIAIYTVILSITALIIIDPSYTMLCAKNSLALCAEVIIPSLFPFFVCSGLLIYSGFTEVLSKIFAPVMRPLFGINGSGSAAFILGIISGYPLGASTACSLYESGYLNRSETERLLGFCNNSGPLFILGAVGASLLGNIKIGWIIYISHILSAFIIGIIFKYSKKDYDVISPQMSVTTPKRNIGEIFSIVMSNSINSILNVCGVIVFSSTVIHILLGFVPFSNEYTALITGLFEFASGINAVSMLDISEFNKIILSVFIVGFAGISVHLQVMSIISKYSLSMKKYLTGKILHAFISAVVVYFSVRYTPILYSFTPASPSVGMNKSFITALIFIGVFVSFILITALFKRKRSADFHSIVTKND